MEGELRRAPTFVEVFTHTHTKKSATDETQRVVDPLTQQKIDEMTSLVEKDSTLSDLELTEQVFGAQNKGRVIGMGSGVRPTSYRGDYRSREASSRSDFMRAQNLALQEQVTQLTEKYEDSTKQVAELKEQHEASNRQIEASNRQIEELRQSQAELQAQMLMFMSRFPPPQ